MAGTPSLSIIEDRIEEFAGLEPRAVLCVGPGFGREEVKSLFFDRGISLSSSAIVGLDSLAQRVAGIAASRVLASTARQEVLRSLLAERRILSSMPELRRLRRQRGFFRRLDRAIQSGRLTWSHPEEFRVHEERIGERLGANPVRDEIALLVRAYEAWMKAKSYFDPPMVLRLANARMRSNEPIEALPASVFRLHVQQGESLEREFWEGLSRHSEVVDLSASSLVSVSSGSEMEEGGIPEDAASIPWRRWHTFDDAAEALADELETLSPEELQQQVVLIPDQGSIRRSVRRAFESRGIPLADPRDPMRLRFDESVKRALLPLDVVSSRMERRTVLAWLRSIPAFSDAERATLSREVHSRGVRQGLGGYEGGRLTPLHAQLKRLEKRFGPRLKAAEFGKAWLDEMGSESSSPVPVEGRRWLLPFLERMLESLVEDLDRVDGAGRKAPILYWLERISERFDEATPPVERFKPRQGVVLSRLGQAPLRGAQKLHLFGLPTQWLSGDGVGDLWFPERERETLGLEFGVRCTASVRLERVSLLNAWDQAVAGAISILDAHYDWDGRERESLLPLLRETGWEARAGSPQELGAHRRWLPSFGALRPTPPQELLLPGFRELGIQRIPATDLDHYSRCSFVGLAKGRWKLYDAREAEPELWPEVRGRILHAAVGLLLGSRDAEGQCTMPVQEALDSAWRVESPRGLLRGERLEALARSKMIEVLEAFVREEKKYYSRARTSIHSLEGPALEWTTSCGVGVHGVPDRVDEHPDGIFVLDFKSSAANPKADEMVGLGYRLQLPFYALAVSRQLGRAPLGVQFVELNRKAGRGSGIFFKQWNGKDPGSLTQARSNSRSLLDLEPQEAWNRLLEHLDREVATYAEGRFAARPKIPGDCKECAYRDLCGRGRMAPDAASPEDSANE